MFAGTKKGIGVDRRPPGVTCRPRVTHQSSPSNRSILYSRSARQEYERSCPYGRSSSNREFEFDPDPMTGAAAAATAATRSQRFFFL
ncbi:hypothetical protein OUZ56_003815 [Daphnia magna]|uniref:Uncharacterized protein n=1 Tax=Daphnia magna TaxID=35525 RepID=A0ABQ9YMV4_9CRUS|nr:hypothetical protein OUZ56_003815 [Daphnia magna]